MRYMVFEHDPRGCEDKDLGTEVVFQLDIN